MDTENGQIIEEKIIQEIQDMYNKVKKSKKGITYTIYIRLLIL